MAVNTGSGAAVGGQGAALAHGTTRLCDLTHFSLFIPIPLVLIFFQGICGEATWGTRTPARPLPGAAPT